MKLSLVLVSASIAFLGFASLTHANDKLIVDLETITDYDALVEEAKGPKVKGFKEFDYTPDVKLFDESPYLSAAEVQQLSRLVQ